MTRYRAQWVAKQHIDEYDFWEPDEDEYRVSYHASKDEAERAAIVASKQADQCEWINVAEQKFIRREWVTQRLWSGDWEGLHEEVQI